ncbi:MAG: S41 family peptidase [Tannerellaceae bacterium]|nr:S41 family peptidase [Tannerellaceae bacterium]
MADEYNTSPQKNFEALWKILDENYCFFDYKGIDWDEVHDKYSLQIDESMYEYKLFQVLSDMVNELKDGHINLNSSFFFSSYEGWYTEYPSNFSWGILNDKYLVDAARGGNYNEIRYTRFAGNQIGYIYYGSFRESMLETELDSIFHFFENCKALVIDVRDNGGGSLINSDRLASRFLTEKTLCGYIQHKTGKGRSDFSDPYPIYLKPSHNTLWLKPVMVLTNRRCYSASNNFVSKMRELPNVRTLGGSTGGGSGFPFTSELPNGWSIRFSTSPILDVNMQHTEFGIEPDVEINLLPQDIENRRDALLEAAMELLLSGV